MDNIDPSLAQRVWQRVQNPAAPVPEASGTDADTLAGLIRDELTDAAACLRLSKTLGGRGGLLVELAREDQSHAGCLRGICTLLTGKAPETHTPAPESGPAAAILRRCYTGHLHRIREYRRRSADPDFGPAFEKLAAEEQNHCKILLELMGKL